MVSFPSRHPILLGCLILFWIFFPIY
jgi:hypothetical protein